MRHLLYFILTNFIINIHQQFTRFEFTITRMANNDINKHYVYSINNNTNSNNQTTFQHAALLQQDIIHQYNSYTAISNELGNHEY